MQYVLKNLNYGCYEKMIKKLNFSIDLKRPDVVIFDSDNTLYEYDIANKMAENAVEKNLMNRFNIDSNLFKSTYQKSKKEIKSQLGKTASSHSRLLYFQRFLELLGFKAKLKLALELEEIFWTTYLENAFLYPDVKELLVEIKKKKIAIAIVTDLTSNIQMRKLTYFKLEDTFDAFVTSEEVGIDKPDPKVFELLLKKLGLNLKNNIWVVGDNPATDIIGGKSIGAVTFQKIQKNIDTGEGAFMPDFTFKKFNDLRIFFSKFE